MEWMEKIFSLVPDQLKVEQFASDIQDLSETIREDYQLSVKKAIVDFVLKDNRQLSVSYQIGSVNKQVADYLYWF